MTDTAQSPVTQLQPLEPFEGRDVIKSVVKITNAGDGLSDGLSIEPQAFHLGEKRYIVLECDVSKVQHLPIKDTDHLAREQTFRAMGAVIVDPDLVKDLVAQQKDRILEAKEAAAGIERLPFEDDEDDEDGHNGEHVLDVPEFHEDDPVDADGFYDPALDPEVAAPEATDDNEDQDEDEDEDEVPEPTPIAGRRKAKGA